MMSDTMLMQVKVNSLDELFCSVSELCKSAFEG
jgi:hypothetical protein